ncbi:MAG: inorganic phosphate transporter [Proteobacteria bacterium]|nr:inorganic phosphate transporter [Pseudomonadota bacterium]
MSGMDASLLLVIFVIFVALVFDFINGFHDAANAIATVVATRVLSPFVAVLWSAAFNVLAVFVIGTGVAKMVGKGLIDLHFVTVPVILAGLLGAITWNLLTWWWKIPSSSSHTLIGGYAGAAMANAALTEGIGKTFAALIPSGWILTLAFIFIAPITGLLLAYVMMILTSWLFHRVEGPKAERWFRRAQLVSSAFMSLSHGGNDAQKTAGIITGVLVSAGALRSFEVPHWVLWSAYLSMGLCTLAGGWRIVKTMSRRITHLRPQGGFCAETAAALSILLATQLKLPISTTHVITGAITGVGVVAEADNNTPVGARNRPGIHNKWAGSNSLAG